MKEEKGLVKKIGWAYNVKDIWPSEMKFIVHCQKLEDEGFGMLASKDNPQEMDGSDSVVCPDGSILTPNDILSYWEGRCGYNPKDPEDIKMNKAEKYYLAFKS